MMHILQQYTPQLAIFISFTEFYFVFLLKSTAYFVAK